MGIRTDLFYVALISRSFCICAFTDDVTYKSIVYYHRLNMIERRKILKADSFGAEIRSKRGLDPIRVLDSGFMDRLDGPKQPTLGSPT